MTETALPRHVAIIMDGNGRWAEARGKTRVHGHRAGAETVRRIVTHARRIGIRYLTLYAFSTENWARPRAEVAALMRLLGRFIESELPTLQKNDIRLGVIGDPGALSAGLRRSVAEAVLATGGNAAMTLTLAINYGGRDEIIRAMRRAVKSAGETGTSPMDIDEQAFGRFLDAGDMPDPDLVVRTAGEQRLSNFLIWQAAYAELYFTPVTWPDFSAADFDTALAEYAKRTRKFGGL